MVGYRPCIVTKLLNSVTGDHAIALRGIVHLELADGGLTADDAARVIREAGLAVSPSSITRHRRGTCGCIGRLGDEQEPTRPTA